MTSTTQTSTPPKDMVVADGNDFSLIDTGPRDGHQTRASEMSAIALVQARTLMAVKFRNDIDVTRQGVLKECSRPQFAETAMYALPRAGKTIRGLSIHFADMALQHMRNVQIQYHVELDNEQQRIVRVTAVNLETNSSWDELAVVDKTVERKRLKEGQVPISQRLNSYGDVVFIVPADEGDFVVKMRAELAKRRRDVILRCIPEWLREEAIDCINETMRKPPSADVDLMLVLGKQRRKLLDRLHARGVTAEQVALYLGHPAEHMTGGEYRDLIQVGQALAEGSTTWDEVIQQRRGADDTKRPPPRPADDNDLNR